MNSSERKMFIFIAICTILMVIFGYTWKKRADIPHVSAPLLNVITPFSYGANTALDKIETGFTIIDNGVKTTLGIKEANDAAITNKVDQVNYDELVAENMRLRQLLRYKTSHPQFTLASAHIIGREFGYGLKTITIDIGANQGIKKNMAVVAPGGVVGFVSDVYANSARVQSLLDPRTSVGVIVQRPESRLVSLVKGDISSTSELQLVNIPKDADLLEGDTLITSGFGGIYPKGIIVGYVGSIKTNSEGYVNHAEVNPIINFYKLEEVFVITGSTVPAPVWKKTKIKLIPATKRDQVEGVKGAINNAIH